MKTIAKAALVVGAVALVASGIGAAAGAGIGFGLSASTLGTIAVVAKVATVGAALLSTVSALAAKKPSAQATGSQSSFSADPDAGIPLIIGRTGTAGQIVARFGFDTKDAGDNDRQSFISVLSLGPVKEVEPTLGVDRSPVSFDAAGRAIGAFRDFMWRTTQVGLLTSAALAFGTGAGAAPGWTAQHKLSGKAATAWTLRFDTKAKLFQNGVPAPMNVVKGQFCYDPRKDSTYPGGSGPHRMADPADRAAYDSAVATWEYSECPYLNGLRYVHGYWQRDMANPTSNWQRVMGMGAPLAGIDLASFVEGANVSDANGWKVGGVIYSGDDKWASLKKVLQAGMGEPLALGAKVSCLVNAPKVSLATITVDDVVGDASVGATQPRRDRVNTITPRYRLEANNWQLLPGSPISIAQHVADDRGKRSRTQDYPFIQDSSQVGTAVRYDIENAREFGPIVLPCKLFWMGYKPGDCVTAELPELGLVAQPILLLNRALNPSSGTVTLTARSETPAKHPFALGQTATPPPTPGVTGAPIVPVPGVDAWTLSGGSIQADGVTLAALTVTGAVVASAIDGVTFDYRPFVSGQADEAGWIAAGTEAVDVTRKVITGVRDLAPYEVSIRYGARGFTSRRRILGPVGTGAATVSWGNGVIGPAKPADNATNSADPNSPFGPGGTVGDAQRAIDAAKARQDALENQTIPAINQAVTDAGTRITAARSAADAAKLRADAAFVEIGSQVTRVDQRIDAISASGGYDDTAVYAEVSRVDQAAIGRDVALGSRVDTVSASVTTTDGNLRALVQTKEDAAVSRDDAISRRIDTLIAEGGGGSDGVDTVARAEVSRVEQASITRDSALGSRVDTVAANFASGDAAVRADVKVTTDALAQADLAFASRQTVLEASSRADPSMLNGNANFSDWPDGQVLPSLWSDATSNAASYVTRVAGKVGRWAMRVAAPGHEVFSASTGNGGFDSGPPDYGMLAIPGRWYVAVADFELESGVLQGAGLYADVYNVNNGLVQGSALLVPFNATSPDGVSAPLGSGIVGRRYRFSQLFQVTAQGASHFRFHPMTSWSVFSGGARTLVWHKAGIRLATPEEIAARRADTNADNALAKIAVAESTLADLPNRYATAQRASNIEASVGQFSGRISAVETVTSNGTFATASRAEQIASYAGGVNARVDVQAGSIATLQGRAAAYWRVESVAGNNRAQLTVSADANGGAGVDIVGDVSISGNLLVGGTVVTAKIADNATKGGVAQVGGSKSFTTASTLAVQVNYTVSSPASDVIITAAGAVLISPGAAAATRANLIVSVNGSIVLNEQIGSRGILSNFNYPIPTGGLQGACNIQMTITATGGNGQDDPHIINRPTLIVQEFKK